MLKSLLRAFTGTQNAIVELLNRYHVISNEMKQEEETIIIFLRFFQDTTQRT